MEDLYYEISNNDSLNDDTFLLSCLEAYKKSYRPYKNLKDGKRYSNFYEFITSSKTEDKTAINKREYEEFYVNMTNEWIESIKEIDEEEIDEYDLEDLYYLKFKNELKRTPPVKTIKDVQRLYDRLERKIGLNINNLFWRHVQNIKYYENFDDAFKSFTHISSKYTKYKGEGIDEIDYRLYINCANEDLFKLLNEYIKKCNRLNIPYLIKFTADTKRHEKFVVYTSKNYLKDNINILKEISENNPKIKQNCGPNSLITGNIDNWIGLGSEPKNEKLNSKFSFNSLRSQILEDAAELTIINYVKRNFNREYKYRGTNISLEDIILIISSNIIINEMKNISILKENTNIRKITEKLSENNSKQIMLGFEKMLEISEDKNRTYFENKNPIFEIYTKANQLFYCSVETMDKIIKSLVDFLIDVEPNFIELYRSEIRKLCLKYQVDPNNFSLNINAIEDFKINNNFEIKKVEMYSEANRLIFEIFLGPDLGLDDTIIKNNILKVIEIIEKIKSDYNDTKTTLLLAKNLNFVIKNYEKKIKKPKHMKKTTKEIELEEIINNFNNMSQAHRELMKESKY